MKNIENRLKYYVEQKKLVDKEDIKYLFKEVELLNKMNSDYEVVIYDLETENRLNRYITSISKIYIDSLNCGGSKCYLYVYVKYNDYDCIRIRKDTKKQIKKILQKLTGKDRFNYDYIFKKIFNNEKLLKDFLKKV